MKQNSITFKRRIVTLKQNRLTVKQNSITVKQISITFKQRAVTMKRNRLIVKQNSITVKQNSITLEQKGVRAEKKVRTENQREKVTYLSVPSLRDGSPPLSIFRKAYSADHLFRRWGLWTSIFSHHEGMECFFVYLKRQRTFRPYGTVILCY